jgi:hypothetical protein
MAGMPQQRRLWPTCNYYIFVKIALWFQGAFLLPSITKTLVKRFWKYKCAGGLDPPHCAPPRRVLKLENSGPGRSLSAKNICLQRYKGRKTCLIAFKHLKLNDHLFGYYMVTSYICISKQGN